MQHPLLPPLAALATGIFVSRLASFGITELLTVIAAFAILCAISLWRRARVLAGACCLFGFVFAGSLVDLARRPAPRPELDAEGREPVILSGCVVQPARAVGATASASWWNWSRARAYRSLPTRVEGQAPPALHYGQRVEFEARVRRPRNFGNPGAFDNARYLARRNIYWTASMSTGAEVTVLPGQCGSRFEAAIMGLRVMALDRLAQLYRGKPYESGMMQAVMIGETYQVRARLDGAVPQHRHLSCAGDLGHAHRGAGRVPDAGAAALLRAARACPVHHRGAAVAVCAWSLALDRRVYAALPGSRIFAIATYFARERRILNILAAVAIGFLLLDPEQMFEASFQLTFLAVGFIGAFATPLLERTAYPRARALADLPDTGRDMHIAPAAAQFRVEMRLLAETLRHWTRLPERASCLAVSIPARVLLYAFQLAVVSAIVQVGLALPMVAYFHRIGFSGVSANADRGAADVRRNSGGLYRYFHRLGMGRQSGRMAAGSIARRGRLAYAPGTQLAYSGPAAVAGYRDLCSVPGRGAGETRRPGRVHCGRGCPGGTAGTADLASVPARNQAPRTGDDRRRCGTRRQHPAHVPGWQADDGGWRRHSYLWPARARPDEHRRGRGIALLVEPVHQTHRRDGVYARACGPYRRLAGAARKFSRPGIVDRSEFGEPCVVRLAGPGAARWRTNCAAAIAASRSTTAAPGWKCWLPPGTTNRKTRRTTTIHWHSASASDGIHSC